jgi:acyl carrier protein
MTDHLPQIIDAICEIDATQRADALNADTLFTEDLGFDSGSFIEMFLILEETIEGFSLGSTRLEPEDFATPASLSRFITRRLTELEVAA